MSQNIQFGWGAASFSEQLPALSPADAAAFDEDNRAIIRLSVRGRITSSERDKAIQRTTRAIRSALTAPERSATQTGDRDDAWSALALSKKDEG